MTQNVFGHVTLICNAIALYITLFIYYHTFYYILITIFCNVPKMSKSFLRAPLGTKNSTHDIHNAFLCV